MTEKDKDTKKDSELGDKDKKPADTGKEKEEKKEKSSVSQENVRIKKRIKIMQELLQELYSLRSNLEEIFEHSSIRMNSQIAEIISLLEKENAPGEKVHLPSIKNMNIMIRKIKNKKLKPKKGRIKDIGKIEVLIKSLYKRIPPQT